MQPEQDGVTGLPDAVNYQLVRFRFRSITMPGGSKEPAAQLAATVDAIAAHQPSVAQARMDEYTDAGITSLRRSFRRQ